MPAKDTPNFIANRIGTFSMLNAIRQMQALEMTIEEVDACTGPAIGQPKSATFRTADLVGLDMLVHVIRNIYENATSRRIARHLQSSAVHGRNDQARLARRQNPAAASTKK